MHSPQPHLHSLDAANTTLQKLWSVLYMLFKCNKNRKPITSQGQKLAEEAELQWPVLGRGGVPGKHKHTGVSRPLKLHTCRRLASFWGNVLVSIPDKFKVASGEELLVSSAISLIFVICIPNNFICYLQYWPPAYSNVLTVCLGYRY